MSMYNQYQKNALAAPTGVKSSSLNIELKTPGKSGFTHATQETSLPKPTYAEAHSFKQHQTNLFHLQAQAYQQQSPTHFFASLLQTPAVLQNPELMASVASMLQSSLANSAPHMAPAGGVPTAPMVGNMGYPNDFRNFSIPHSDSSGQPRSTLNSSICGTSDHGSSSGASRTPSQNSGSVHPSSRSGTRALSRKNSSGFSMTSSDNDSHNDNNVDIGKFKNNTELVINKVMTVIDEILANGNIKKNNFLAKLFEDNEDQPSSIKDTRPQIYIKRVAGFKRVKAITTEFKIVQAAMGKSKMFELAADGLSAFRTQNLPILNNKGNMQSDHQDKTLSSRTNSVIANVNANANSLAAKKKEKDNRVVKKILAINFNAEEFNIEKMTTIFEKIGEIAQIMLVRPNKKVPDLLAEYQQWVPDLGTKPCAIIDFENQDAAQNACREINMSNREGSAIRCALLKPGARIKRTLYRKYSPTSSDSTDTFNRTSQTSSSDSHTVSRDSADSGINQNVHSLSGSKFAKPSKFNRDTFNKKNTKKAITKHFISLGAWKNSSTANVNAEENSVIFRLPKGPVSEGSGFGLKRQTVA